MARRKTVSVQLSWWRHQMEACSALLPHKGPIMRTLILIFLWCRSTKLLNKQSNDWCFETSWQSCDVIVMIYHVYPLSTAMIEDHVVKLLTQWTYVTQINIRHVLPEYLTGENGWQGLIDNALYVFIAFLLVSFHPCYSKKREQNLAPSHMLPQWRARAGPTR